jgi:hypothetical protein
MAERVGSAEWQFISEASNGAKFFMDLSTKRQQGKYTLVWTRWNLPKAQLVNGKSFNSARALTVFDCFGFRNGSKTEIYYGEISGVTGAVEMYSWEMHEVKFRDVVPETIGELMFKAACSK